MDYKNGKIYKIVCNITGDVYIGSTTQPLAKRLSHHKSHNCCSSSQIIDRGDYVIVLIEAFPCENKSELFKRERYHYDIIPNINKLRPFVTEEESIESHRVLNDKWYQANTEAISKYKKEAYQANKEAISKKAKAKYQAKKEANQVNTI